MAEPDPVPEVGSSKREIFVSSTLNTFGGIVDAHNGLACSLCQTEQQLEAAIEDHAKNMKDHLERQEELKLSQEQALQQAQNENRELYEALKALLEERSGSLESRTDKSFRALDDSLRPMIKAMERNVEDVVRAQADWTGVTLPRWRTDIATDVQRLSSDLAEHIGQWEIRAREHEAQIATQETQLAAVRSDFEHRLTTKLDLLEAGLAAAAEECVSLASEMRTSVAELRSTQVALREQMEIQDKTWANQLRAEAKAMVEQERPRVLDLEAVVKQADYERKGSVQKLGVDVDSLRAEMPSLRAWAKEQIVDHLQKGLSATSAEINSKLDKLTELMNFEVQMLSTRIGTTESDTVALRVLVDNADQLCKDTDTSMRAHMQDRCKTLAGQFNAEVDAVRNLVSQEGVRVTKVEAILSETISESNTGDLKLTQEVNTMREHLEAVFRQHTEQHFVSRIKPVQQSMAEMEVMIQDMGRVRADKDAKVDELATAMREVQQKVWPWKYRNDRPLASPAVPFAAAAFRSAAMRSAGRAAGTPASPDDGAEDRVASTVSTATSASTSNTASGPRPTSARPGSAHVRRVLQQAGTGERSQPQSARTGKEGGLRDLLQGPGAAAQQWDS